MKILLIADEESRALWDFYEPSKTEGIDLIISCGDLHPDYLQFLVTMTNCPLLYVRGNHDGMYDSNNPDGCIDIDDRVYDYRGLRILGLGGSMRYRPGKDMYTEQEMRRRINRMTSRLFLMNGFDILITHAPARGYGDMDDLPHRGFQCFNDLIGRWRPAYMCYGHVHREYGDFRRQIVHGSGTKLINACGFYILDIGEGEYPGEGKTGSAVYDLYISMKKRLNREL